MLSGTGTRTTDLHGGWDASVGLLTTHSDVFISRINSFSHKFKSLISGIGYHIQKLKYITTDTQNIVRSIILSIYQKTAFKLMIMATVDQFTTYSDSFISRINSFSHKFKSYKFKSLLSLTTYDTIYNKQLCFVFELWSFLVWTQTGSPCSFKQAHRASVPVSARLFA